MVAALLIGPGAGLLLSSATAAASSHKQRAHRNASPVGSPQDYTYTRSVDGIRVHLTANDRWMNDLAGHLWYRKLTDILIPSSHDADTYSLDQSFKSYAITQTEDLTAQLNDGIREFDIRVEYHDGDFCDGQSSPAGYYAKHGSLSNGKCLDVFSSWLTLKGILDQIKDWTLNPAHRHEVVMFNLGIDDHNGEAAFPTDTCKAFDDALGSALLTPREAQADFGTTDPGQITLGQLWSIHGPQGPPRVIMNDDQCLAAGRPDPGKWSPDDPFGGYYADQCYADPYLGIVSLHVQPGVQSMVLLASTTRATYGGGDDNGHPVNPGPPKVGGLWNLGIMATPTEDCYQPLRGLFGIDDLGTNQQVLAALYDLWQQGGPTKRYLNIISADFVQETDLVKDVLAMNETFPVRPLPADSISRLGEKRVALNLGDRPANAFGASVSAYGLPVANATVTYKLSGDPGGPSINGSDSATAVTGADGVAHLSGLDAGQKAGVWTLSASVAGVSAKAEWTLAVHKEGRHELLPVSGNPTTVQVTNTTSKGFAVELVGQHGEPIGGEQVRFDALNTTGAGTFPGGHTDAYEQTDQQGIATSPPLTAGTQAGAKSIRATWNDIQRSLPVTVTGGVAVGSVPDPGTSLQSTPINTKFPVPLSGYLVDKYGNHTASMPESKPGKPYPVELFVYAQDCGNGATSCPLFPGGLEGVIVKPAADGKITAPDLTAGQRVYDGPDLKNANDTVRVVVSHLGYSIGSPWYLHVVPGPLTAVTISGGDGQQTGEGQPFAQPLAAKVTDARRTPIPGARVTFTVTSGDATFPPLDRTVTARTHDDGVASAPVLTAGVTAGPIEVTASADFAPAATQAVFHLSATGVAPTAPSITNLGNGDGQVAVGFSGAIAGSSPITSYEVSAIDQNHPTAPPATATGPSSPITVSALTNGDTYQFTVTATSADGTSLPSAPSGALNVGVPPVIVSGPADGVLGKPYSSRFEVTGAPPPTITQVSGDLPPGLTLGSDGSLTGTPTKVGTYEFTVQADNHVGIADATVPVTISPATLGAAPPPATGRHVSATICTRPEGKPQACDSVTLVGTFLPLGAGAEAILARGTVPYAVGQATAHYGRLILHRRRQIPAGRYTLTLRRGDHAIILPVTVR